MPKKMILPIAFIIMTLFFVVKGFYNNFIDDGTEEEEQRQAESIKEAQERREYDLKLQACIKQQNDKSFEVLSSDCKMMIILWEKESDSQSAQQ